MRTWRLVLVAVFAAAPVAWGAPVASAATFAPAGAIGHDVSHPQCGDPLPTGGSYGIVGVNGGKVFEANPCLAEQYDWAAGRPHDAMVYVNTGNPGPVSVRWPKAGSGPARCVDADSYADPGCAYNYGWKAAEHSVAIARAAGVRVDGTWWLDVETSNSWDDRDGGVSNTADLQGAFDYLHSTGIDQVGIYSTNFQWRQITGGYTAATASAYRAAWGKQVEPRRAMEKAPLWIAGARDATDAVAKCATGITGGPTVLAQWIGRHLGNALDHNRVCGESRPVPASAAPCLAGGPPPAGYVPVYGTDGDDELRGTRRDEIFFGGAGADDIRGGRGDDILCGGPGGDDLRGADGSDRLEGEKGRDDLSGGSGRDRLNGGGGADELSGGDGRDDLRGGGGNDELDGDGGRDRLKGQGGRDTLDGGSARDRCSPGPGRDPAPRSC